MKLIFQILLCSFLFVSCRQDIVDPDNPGNINEPFFSRTNNSYSFTINAKGMNATVIDNTLLQTFKSRIFSIVNDHSSGSLDIKVQTMDNSILYSAVFNNNTDGIIREITGNQPEVIILNFRNFSGKFKVTLTNIE